MCNCSPTPANVCNQCNVGQPCCCPPDYSIMPQPAPCGCCPDGYTYFGPTANWPDGYCASGSGPVRKIQPPIPCNNCAETISSDCVILPEIACLGIPAGTNLTTLFAAFCANPKPFIEFILSAIGLDPDLGSGLCQLVQNCPPPGSGTTPIIGTIIVTFP